tara:strand:+ start:121 stop:795 length:675 start_codon:yes stop_codon:yes gene_type:complete
MLKADLHIHTKEDAKEPRLKHSAKDVIDKAKELGITVLSFSFHDSMFDDEATKTYAKERGIVLLPGIEKTIEKNHVLLYNFTQEELDKINVLEDIKKVKQSHHLVVAPHPFFKTSSCLGKKLYTYADVFDGVELCFFYTEKINFNKEAIRFAKEHNLPLIANSDLHNFSRFGKQYSLIDAPVEKDAIIEAIKAGKVQLVTNPLTFIQFIKITTKQVMNRVRPWN